MSTELESVIQDWKRVLGWDPSCCSPGPGGDSARRGGSIRGQAPSPTGQGGPVGQQLLHFWAVYVFVLETAQTLGEAGQNLHGKPTSKLAWSCASQLRLK